MGNKNSRWSSRCSGFSSPGKERRTQLSAEDPYSTAFLPIRDDGHDNDNFSSNTDHIQRNGSRPIDPSKGFSPSASSSSQTVPNIIKAIREEAENSDLDAIIQRLYALLETIKTQRELQKKTQRPKESQKKTQMPTSDGFLKVKDLLLEGVNGICSVAQAFPAHDAQQVVRDIVKGLGQAHWVTSCFLLVSYILDRFETLSSNQEGCLDLLEQMYYLAVDLKKAAGIEKLTGWERLAKEGTELIMEASLMCCCQIDRSKLSRFFTTTVDAGKLLHFKNTLATFNGNMVRKMTTWICSSLLCDKVRPAVHREDSYPEYAVGIEERLNSVTELLQWESEERAVAVIVHGFGGIGKSTLANAVFARYFVKDCKYSVVRLDSSPERKPQIVKLQKNILKDLMRRTESGRESKVIEEGKKILDFNDFEVGRTRIGDLLQKEAAFIYIDNVVNPESLKELLVSSKLKDAKKLRLLVTTRDINVLDQLGNMTRKVHEMQPLSHEQGKSFLSKEIYNWRGKNNEEITDKEREEILNEIVNISGGIPKILDSIAGRMQFLEDQRAACGIIKEDSEELTGETFRDIEKAIFAYNDLRDEYKSPFLDICFFLKGWKWETVANIVGESQLKGLEQRALVYKDENMNVRLHDIILKIGKEKARDGKVKARDTRIDFTEAPDDEIQDFFEKDMKYLQLIKGLWFSDQACNIPVTKLNSMKDSLRIFGHKMVLENGQCENKFSKLIVYKGETPHFPFKWSCLKNLTFLSYQPQNLNLLKEIPSSNLKHIELDGSLCSVSEILSSDIQQLRALQVLRLINFHNLEKLPEEWGEYLRENLKELTLSNCTAMKQLPGSISQLTSLKILKLDNCCNLRRLHKDCESLSSSLQKLNVLNCRKLKSLPSCFAEALDSDSRLFFQDEGILSDSPQSDSDSPPAAKGQTVSDEEQVGLPSASPSTETVSKKEQVGLPLVSDEEQVGLPSASPSTETVSKKEQVGLPSASSSTQTVSNLINAIREDAETVKPELDALINSKSMEEESSTPLFTVGQDIATFLVSCGILPKAWEESCLANNSESYSVNEYEDVAYVAFPSFYNIEGFIVKGSKYGEGNIEAHNNFFSGCVNGNGDQATLVHQGALNLLIHIMENTDFQAKMQVYTDSKQRKLKPVIFVGHSIGGAVATLATLWILQKRLRQSSPFCITFGCPLVGDVNLVEAVGRENWAGNFLHVVSKNDIVPRMLLAPVESISEPLIAIFPYWQGIMQANDSKTIPDSSIQDASRTFLNNVLQYALTIANYELDSSPYRPFGTYMFCSSEGAACIDNSELVLKMLHLTMQSHEKPCDNIVMDCLSEHVEYGSALKHAIEKSISGENFAEPDSESSYKMGMSLQLEAIGVGVQHDDALIAMEIARGIESKHNTNAGKLAIELSEKQLNMAEVEWYKERCEKEDGITYYDSFKKHEDVEANERRLKLAGFWDEIIEMWERHELPSDFQSQNKWINAGNTYRRLVEPLDIAFYYGMSKGKGNYLSDGRPNRYKVLQEWMEAKEKTRSLRGQRSRTKPASLTTDSCFWARVEEARKDLENLKQGQHQSLQTLEEFEKYVTTMNCAFEISPDVFFKGSSFMAWFEEWEKYKRDNSP